MDQFGPTVWIFHGDHARFASGVFQSRERGLAWIAEHSLTGTLTEYPVDVGAFDDAVTRGRFKPSREHHGSPEHVAGFPPAYDHLHVASGQPDV